MSDFAQIMLAEMRNYTSRKVIYAFNYSLGSPTQQLFTLRMITANIDQMANAHADRFLDPKMWRKKCTFFFFAPAQLHPRNMSGKIVPRVVHR